MVTRLAFSLLSLSVFLVLCNSTPLILQYVLLGCQGSNNIRDIARLSRVCEHCYAMYRNPDIPVVCRTNCYNNEAFDQCARSVAKEREVIDLLNLAQEIGQKPLRR